MKRLGVVLLAVLFISLTVSPGQVGGAPRHPVPVRHFRGHVPVQHFPTHHFHHFHHGHGRFFFGVGVGAFVTAPFWYPAYAYPAYPYPVYPNYPAPPPVYWYYCQDPPGYYPYVSECPGGWLMVVPPGTAP